mgnify:CR=1 FL=1
MSERLRGVPGLQTFDGMGVRDRNEEKKWEGKKVRLENFE